MSKSQYCIDNIDVCLLGVSDIAVNLYGFVGSNPVNWVDPWELQPVAPPPPGPNIRPVTPPFRHTPDDAPWAAENGPEYPERPEGFSNPTYTVCTEVCNECPRGSGPFLVAKGHCACGSHFECHEEHSQWQFHAPGSGKGNKPKPKPKPDPPCKEQ